MRSRPSAVIVPTSLALALVLGGAVAGISSCRGGAPVDPLRREGVALIDGPSLVRFLDRAARLTGTPAGRASAKLGDRIGRCAEVALHRQPPATDAGNTAVFDAASKSPTAPVAASESPIEALRCRDEVALPPALAAWIEAERGAHAGFAQWPIGRAGRIALTIDVDDAGGLELAGRLEPDPALGGLAFLLPAASPPAAAVIDPDTALAHLHLRSASGTGLARLVPKDSQGDRLFALKSRLLEGALLEGTLELAFVSPAPTGRVPLATLALHHRGAAPIQAALAEALARLEQTWSIAPSERRFAARDGGEWSGGCYADLPLLPELAPCWVVTDEALLVGYRVEAIEAVLAGPTPSAPPPDTPAPPPPVSAPAETRSPSGLVVDFDQIRGVDRRLVEASVPTPGDSDPTRWPRRLSDLYTRLELAAEAAPDGAIAIRGRLRARP